MMKPIKVADLPEFDVSYYLESDAAVVAYLTDILEANDTAILSSAIFDIARSRGLSDIAKSAGISREALYEALISRNSSSVSTIENVLIALGVRVVL